MAAPIMPSGVFSARHRSDVVEQAGELLDATGSASHDAGGESRAIARWVVRGALHLLVWASVAVPTAVELARGWRPYGDDAAIASRAYQVFSSHPPLSGLASAASNQTGHELYGLGPLLFDLLAVPVRLDPARGLLWGAALWCGLVLSVALEAAWRCRGWLAAAIVALAVFDLLWRTPSVFANLAWNASFPVLFLLAAVVSCWAVGTGSRRWWPVLVACASVVAQCHLFLVLPAFLLVVAGLALGLRLGTGRLGWVVAGVGVGVLCWIEPLIQQLADRPGNLVTVATSAGGQQELGVSFALRDLAMAGALHPIWSTRLPSGFFPLAALETAYPAWYGGVLLGVLALVTLVALATGRRALGSFAAATAALSVGLVVSLAIFPDKNILSLGYLVVPFWLVGLALWLVAGWCLAVALEVLWRWWARRRGSTPLEGRARSAAHLGLAAIVAAAVGGAGALGLVAGADPPAAGWSPRAVTELAQAGAAIERMVPPGPVTVRVLGGGFYATTWLTEALAYRLEVAGWRPGTTGPAATYTGLVVRPGARRVLVRLSRAGPPSVRLVPVGRR